jgi:hypothetical protein
MISSDRIDPVILGHILGQHRELHAQLLALKAAFAARGVPDERRGEAVRKMLTGLRDHLRSHFEQEEGEGFIEESVTRVPRLSPAARQVLAEHPRLLAEIDALLERLPAGDISRDVWREASRGFAAFADHLLAHERSENAVVQEGYNEDMGLVD